MAVNPYTTAVMRALPAALRPNPHAIDEAVMEAVGHGWDTSDLARLSYANDRNPTPAFVVTNIRNLSKHPPSASQPVRKGWDYRHIPCTDPLHPVGCEVCRCIPNEIIHVVVTERRTK